MPELPEVETVRRGISPRIIQQTIRKITIRNHRLRWPIPPDLPQKLRNSTILDIQRRGKYLLFFTRTGTLIVHLGMSGRLQLCKEAQPLQRHDHVDIVFTSADILRYTDPRRFGSILWTEQPPWQHPLLVHLGPEPLSRSFSGSYLYQQAQKRQIPVKSLLMNSQIVTGIGNIYANEALFLAKTSPLVPAREISRERCQHLAQACKQVLQRAIKAGGTTLNDFHDAQGQPGYFSQQLLVYGREDQPCHHCHTTLIRTVLSQRATVYCPRCQKN